ncbi:peptidase M23 [Vibrio sp. qd031]|uniref:M23 family metallopeptidase n=1 Tax=Vibrio sp. qd031 TaxID=1603038 RepID=UPI000A10B521|nr:M23 family metallopeptidase [Vibrio sp. qd031]ORT48579.1 peptidase M23 [Vibrio sp. qd031]
MKQHVIVSISTVEGSRHYQLGKWVRRSLKGLGYLTLLGLVAIGGVIFHLMDEIDLSKLRHDQLRNESQALNEELVDLKSLKQVLEQDLVEREQDILEREDRLLSVSERLGDLEVVLGVANTGGDVDSEIEARLDTAAITSTVRTHMLTLIPSGSPVGDERISSKYGYRIHPETKQKRLHRGIDYAVNIGTPIYAPADGVVEVVRPSNTGSGNFIRLQHAYGFSSSYSHLQKFAVKSGSFIQKGQLIGYSGNSGLSTGPHLHYEIRFVGRALDPIDFVAWDVENFDTIFEKERGIRWDSLVKMVELRVSSQLQLSSQMGVSSPESSG